MKKILLLTIIISLSLCVYSQKIESSKVPAALKAAFDKKYPGIAQKWEMEDSNYEVNFVQHDTKMSVLMDKQGSIIETESEISVTDLPANAVAYLSSHFKGKDIKEAAKIIKADGSINYEAEVGDKDLLFDADGKFLKEEVENEKKDD